MVSLKIAEGDFVEKGQNPKDIQLEQFKVNNYGKKMTTNQGLKVSDDENSLKAGVRGPTFLEDFHFREKITHFDHERIPERVVHARGFAAHGEFELHKSMKEFTKAGFLAKSRFENACIHPVFNRCRKQRIRGYGKGRSRLCHKVLYRRRELRPRRQ